ncbi:hypothetical protein AYO20_03200 [Fonsecaea nubica]|uniref:Alpha/beta hydrolase fold-3 domain-containing protein n=1 Tax=Fonsecaea nubica TaxID=856822 RepID=A0A178D813_9EURO|nr:hypothetical protein AYO20_03200 [Fonsecaea nubica]OAL37351.1 hypothetical protein AYO20_03200 [Fonsecaea nubica]
MPSKESEALAEFYKSLTSTMAANPTLPLDILRIITEDCHQLASEPTDVTYEEAQCAGTVRPAIWCRPLGASTKHVTLFFHGGGFFSGSPNAYRKLGGHIAKAFGTQVLVTDYRRAPEATFPSQIEDSVATYDWLLQQGFAPEQIIISGDSAGGNLALTTTLKILELQRPRPGGVVAFSPWVDIECKGKTMDTNKEKDFLANRESLGQGSLLWLAGQSPQNPLANPFYADLSGYPPLYLVAGGHETLLSDTEDLAEKAKKAGVDVEKEVAEGMQHVHIFMAGRAPEADDTLQKASKWVQSKLKL